MTSSESNLFPVPQYVLMCKLRYVHKEGQRYQH